MLHCVFVSAEVNAWPDYDEESSSFLWHGELASPSLFLCAYSQLAPCLHLCEGPSVLVQQFTLNAL